MSGLQIIFDGEKNEKGLFDIDCVYNIFDNLNHPNLLNSNSVVHQSFMFCMMTVLDEHTKMKKYEYLYFIEFLDMLCRIAMLSINLQGTGLIDTIDNKVYTLLDILWGYYTRFEDSPPDPTKEVVKKIDLKKYPL